MGHTVIPGWIEWHVIQGLVLICPNLIATAAPSSLTSRLTRHIPAGHIVGEDPDAIKKFEEDLQRELLGPMEGASAAKVWPATGSAVTGIRA